MSCAQGVLLVPRAHYPGPCGRRAPRMTANTNTNNNSCSSSAGSSWISNLVRSRSSNHTSGRSTGLKEGTGSFECMARNSEVKGVLFKYGSKPVQVAFTTGDFKQQVIFIGGLTDGLLATEYLGPLSVALEAEKWSLVMPLLSSSYSGYGTSSLKQVFRHFTKDKRAALGQREFRTFRKQDALELDQLINYLINKEGSEGVVLLGHSTGCQDIVHYMGTNTSCSKAVRAAILQAPVSDREYRATLPETAAMIDLAASMIREGREGDLMPREANPDAPITAYRFHSLCAYMGDDDMFSSDLSDDQLRLRLGHMSNIPCQIDEVFAVIEVEAKDETVAGRWHSSPTDVHCRAWIPFHHLLQELERNHSTIVLWIFEIPITQWTWAHTFRNIPVTGIFAMSIVIQLFWDGII